MLEMGLLILLIVTVAGILFAAVNCNRDSAFHGVPRRRRRL